MTRLTDVSGQLKRDIYLHFHNERGNAGACLCSSLIGIQEHDLIITSSTKIARTALRAVDYLVLADCEQEIEDIGNIDAMLVNLSYDSVFRSHDSNLYKRLMLSPIKGVDQQMKDIGFAAGVIRHNLCRILKINPCLTKNAVSKIVNKKIKLAAENVMCSTAQKVSISPTNAYFIERGRDIKIGFLSLFDASLVLAETKISPRTLLDSIECDSRANSKVEDRVVPLIDRFTSIYKPPEESNNVDNFIYNEALHEAALLIENLL